MIPRLALLGITLAGALAAGCKSPDPAPQDSAGTGVAAGPADSATLARADGARIQGDTAATVWLLEISDFQCPYCAMWHRDTYAQVVDEYVRTGKVRMAYINLPIASHVHAQPAAEAAMCAGLQDKFWPVHDGIFKSQAEWTPLPSAAAAFDSIAARAGVSMPAWRQCVASRAMEPMVAADAARANQIGVRSTPSFLVLRGSDMVRGISGAYPIDTFRVVLNGALAGGRPRS